MAIEDDLAPARRRVGRDGNRRPPREYACPECGAEPGARCTDERGRERDSNHKARIEVAQQAVAGTTSGRRKVTVEDDGYLVASDGLVLGRLVSLTIDFDDRRRGEPLRRGEEVEVELQQTSKEETSQRDGGLEETNGAGSAIDRVWAVYVETMQPRRTAIDQQARAVIRDALKVATEDECFGAIQGCKRSSFHMGDNERKRKYNALSQILKGKRGGKTTREQIDMMLSYLDTPVSVFIPSEMAAEISRAKRDVQMATSYPTNEIYAAKGRVALALLAEHGIVPTYETFSPADGVTAQRAYFPEASA
jgi:hypothetical protein